MKDPSSSAALVCSSMGGYLAVMETTEERDLVKARFDATPSLAEILSQLSQSCWRHPCFAASWMGGLAKSARNVSKYTYSNGAWLDHAELPAPILQSTSKKCFVHNATDLSISSESTTCSSKPFICEKGTDYMGCYSKLTYGLPVIVNYKLMNLRQCKESCTSAMLAGYTLYGVGIDQLPTCYCLKPDEIRKENDYDCTDQCAGHQACGAANRISVYSPVPTPVAGSCEELYGQGVLLSGLYQVETPGWYSMCYMPNSSYTGLYPPVGSCGAAICDQDKVLIGQGNTVFLIDVTEPSRVESPEDTCFNVIEIGATIVASVRTAEQMALLTDFLNWNPTGATSTVIGLVDEFLTGSYTWSDGYLYRPGEINVTDSSAPLTNRDRARYTTVDHLGVVAGHTDKHHVACMLDTHVKDDPQCYFYHETLVYGRIKNYATMSVTLCRQVCQTDGHLTFFVSSFACVCGSGPVLAPNVSIAECSKPCPGNRLQICGGTPGDGIFFFKKYTFDTMDIAANCSELYNNLIVLEAAYKLESAAWQTNYTAYCGLEDWTIAEECQTGFMSKNHKCLRFMRLETHTVTEAAAACLDLSSVLASLLTPEDLEDVLNITMNVSSLSTAKLWAIGHYSPLSNGYYVDSFGYLIPPSADIFTGVTLDEQCMALDTENRTLVAVSCNTVLPYICHHNRHVQTNVEAIPAGQFPDPDLSFPTSMTSHQCIELCRGKGSEYSMIRGADCYCNLTTFTFALDETSFSQSCPGNIFQLCGSNFSSIVYTITFLPNSQFPNCDELLNYGITAPGNYIMEDGSHVTCFKYTTHSDYVMANNDDITVEASSVFSSSFTSADAKLDIRTLKPGGWAGALGNSGYYLKFDLHDVYMVQGIILMGVPDHDRMTSLSITHQLTDSHVENYFLNPIDIIYPPTSSLTWIDIEKPFVASQVTITFNAWDGSKPGCSIEFIGFKFYEYWTDSYYLGARGQLQNASAISTVFIIADVNSCVETCRTNGFNYFMINEEAIPAPNTAVCSCLNPSVSTRDFYTSLETGLTCLDSQPCSFYSSPFTSLYSSSTTTCQLPSTTATQNEVTILTKNNPSSSDHPSIGSVFNVTCNNGYTSNLWSGTFTTICANYDRWFPTLIDLTCTRVDCGSPPGLANLTLATTNGSLSTTYESVVSYECEEQGHLINGSDLTWEIECSASGQWLPEQPPSCIVKICLAPTLVNNSYLVHQDMYVYGDVAVMKCDNGSVFDGTYSTSFPMTCQIDGTWDQTPDVPCRALDCPPTLPPVSHAAASLASDLSGHYECNGGRQFPDETTSKTVLCNQDTNKWPSTTETDVCRKTRTFGTNICLVQADKCMDSSILGEVNSRSLVDCVVSCSDTAFCRSVCYRRSSKFLEGAPNCQLISSEWKHEHELDRAGWDFYDTFGLVCS
ncbi:hypothetical protein RRG08_015164 [Elysia crispata]|uniref:Uncharacterized protein n=1 Tax=Elysia crispata TaxID=231223 RepID=A0AAE1E885_9GAST|nr:hypothetical protein RRG08_015164 [Elysia crispata]